MERYAKWKLTTSLPGKSSVACEPTLEPARLHSDRDLIKVIVDCRRWKRIGRGVGFLWLVMLKLDSHLEDGCAHRVAANGNDKRNCNHNNGCSNRGNERAGGGGRGRGNHGRQRLGRLGLGRAVALAGRLRPALRARRPPTQWWWWRWWWRDHNPTEATKAAKILQEGTRACDIDVEVAGENWDCDGYHRRGKAITTAIKNMVGSCETGTVRTNAPKQKVVDAIRAIPEGSLELIHRCPVWPGVCVGVANLGGCADRDDGVVDDILWYR